MKVRDLRALLENIVDDIPIYIIQNGEYVPLEEDLFELVTFDGGKFIGPTALVITTND